MEKKLDLRVKFLQARYPNAEIEVWSMDQQTLDDSLTLRYRIGLHPILRRIWISEGEQPIASVIQKYKWMWLYGFVHPESGETYWWILPNVNTEIFNRVLADFAGEYGLGTDKRIFLAIDQASRYRFNLLTRLLTGITTLQLGCGL